MQRVIDVLTAPVYWPSLREEGYKELKSMLAATVEWELGVDLYGVALWKDIMTLIMAPYPSGALHYPCIMALPTLVENLLSKYADYNQNEVSRRRAGRKG
ncbi:hypothetical protein DUNSADRAFT_2238 [Dunaliella salina]|uniref:Uncharacterized protein n=1 Tax=Dunaliella salina TaxID=3046 RepID=A0ABQ7GW42_DUNSA|nr:hypothetical protein DUNSADRAFT_2238 [Dunaliella salina]|eukprot:KAF5838775.1 hypothetical protein DUNSADRAFT_2238 [Dunaliella salina]